MRRFVFAGLMTLALSILVSACGANDAEPTADDEQRYDVEVTVRTKYEQPPMEDCANSSSTDVTMRFKMPNRLYAPKGCGEATDGKLHVLCGGDAVTMELISDANASHGSTWTTGDVTTQESNAFLSVYRTNGKTVLDFRFDFDSNDYPDPGCSGEMIHTRLYATSLLFNEGSGELWVPFSEIDLSLGVPFTWKESVKSDDSCDIGCYTTTEVTATFTPRD